MEPSNDTPAFSYSRAEDGTWTLRNLEVFKAGDYGDRGYFSDDKVAGIVSKYDATNVHEAPVTVDHERKGPALGWVSGLAKHGPKMFADVTKISDDFFQVLKGHQFKKRSIELFEKGHRLEGQFRALTFLGAAPPRVMGLADPIFSDNDGEPVIFDYLAPDIPYVSMPYGPPSEIPVTQARATILRVERGTTEMLHHRHAAVMDENGNGWTSPACHCGPDVPGDDHQHVVTGGVIQPKADKLGNVHIHTFAEEFEPKIHNEPNQEITIMADEPKVDPVAFADLQSKNADMEARLKESEQTIRQFSDDKAARVFEDAVAKANTGGVRLTPAAARKFRKIYDRLRETPGPVCFEDGVDAPAHDQLLTIFSDLPIIPATKPGNNLDKESARMASDGATQFSDDPAERAAQRVTMADDLKAKGFSDDYDACMLEAEKRMKAAK